MIATKNAWLLRLFVCLCVVTFAFLFVVIFDLMNPSIGFFLRVTLPSLLQTPPPRPSLPWGRCLSCG